MAIQPGVWGIDLGQCALKALRVENIDGQLTATAFDYVEHPKILSQPDADPDQLTREALEKFLSRNSLKGNLVAISIPGQSGLARFVKLPPVEEKKIGDIVRFEAKQQIPFNLEEVVWDYQKLNTGVVTDGFAMETEIGLFAIKRDTVNKYLQHFKDVNVEVHIVQMAPLALCNYVAYDLLQKNAGGEGGEGGKKKCVVALDIGADNSNLVITDGERIIWQRPIPLGGNHFTRALTKDMKLTFAKAEHLKRNATKSPELKQILSSLKPVLNDFVGEVQRSLGYFTNTHRDAQVQYLMGLGSAFRLPGLQKFLAEKLQLDVRKLGKLERLIGDEVVNQPAYTENVLSFAVAYGLALQGLKEGRLQTNLLPNEIRVERMIRGKKPWAVAAAASLLLGTAVLAVGYDRAHLSYASPEIKKAVGDSKSTVQQVATFKKKFEDAQKEIQNDTDAVKSIILGQDERMNWIQFNQFINRSLPRPDGSNLNTEKTDRAPMSARQLYWDTSRSAKIAYENFVAQHRGTAKAGDKVDEDNWRDDLVQANVEAAYTLYCDDLEGFFTKLKANIDPDLLKTMAEKDQKEPPKGKGWVVEIRGYTYHRDGYRFVVKAVVQNLARFPIVVKLGDSTAPPATPPATDQNAQAATPPAATTPTVAPPAAGAAKAATTPPAPATPAKTAAPGVPPAATPAAEDKSKPAADANQVSHVVLYTFKSDVNPEPTTFQLIPSRYIDQLVGGAAGGTGGNLLMGGIKGGGTMPGGGLGTSGGWQPLGTELTSGGGRGFLGKLPQAAGQVAAPGGGQGGASIGLPGLKNAAAALRGGGMEPNTPSLPGSPEAEAKKKHVGKHIRTEFVIMFVWREPYSPLMQKAMEAEGGGSGGNPTAPGSFGGGK
jgi:type IV pilus assembly protein PilM